MSQRNSTTDDSWKPCGGGELQGLAQGLRADRARTDRRKRLSLFAGAGAVAAVVLLTVFFAGDAGQPANSGDMHFAGISCTEVRNEMPDLMEGKVDELRSAQIQDHLRQCAACRERRERMERMERPVSRFPIRADGDLRERPMLAYLEWTPPPGRGD